MSELGGIVILILFLGIWAGFWYASIKILPAPPKEPTTGETIGSWIVFLIWPLGLGGYFGYEVYNATKTVPKKAPQQVGLPANERARLGLPPLEEAAPEAPVATGGKRTKHGKKPKYKRRYSF